MSERDHAIGQAIVALLGEPCCCVCGNRPVDSWPADHPELAICTACCDVSEDGHDYEYDRDFRGHICKHCGAEAPEDWYDPDDWVRDREK